MIGATVTATVASTIEAHEDDSVTLTVGTITAHIKGENWRDANNAAHVLASHLGGQYELAALRIRLAGLRSIVRDVEQSLGMTEFHMRELAEYAVPRTTSAPLEKP